MKRKLCILLLSMSLLAVFSCRDKQGEKKDEFPKLIVLKDGACQKWNADMIPLSVYVQDSVVKVAFFQTVLGFYFNIKGEKGEQCLQMMQHAYKNHLPVDIYVGEDKSEIVRVEQKWD